MILPHIMADRCNSQSNVTPVIPKNILAFRLITKTLARIPQTQPFTSIDNLEDYNNLWSDGDRSEVKISDAFGHLAVAEHDVVAIATNRASPYRTDPTLGVMACTTLSNNSVDLKKAKPKVSSSRFLDKVWNVIFAKNAQEEDPPCLYPIIALPEEPSNFSSFQSLKAYMENLETNW